MIGIYKITSPSGKIYIGSSKNIEKRIRHYIKLDCKGQIKLYNSLKKYGWENHSFEVLEECNIEDLYNKEYHYGIQFNVLGDKGLNSVLPKLGDIKYCVSDDTRLKMSISKTINPTFKGKKHTLESKQLMSQGSKGRTAWNKDMKGVYHHKPETLILFSEIRKGKNNAMYGVKHSNETKEKMLNNRKIKVYVLDYETGIFYTIKELSNILNIDNKKLRNRLYRYKYKSLMLNYKYKLI